MKSRDIQRLWNELTQPVDKGYFQPERLQNLSDPARRYLLYAIRPGAKLASSVHLKMSGSIRLGAKWLPFEAEEILAPPRGFVWRAMVRSGFIRMSGADCYAAGNGSVDFWLWGIFRVVRSSGKDTSRAARGRLVAESFWLPSSLMPGEHVAWRTVDDNTAEVVVDLDGVQITTRLSVSQYGQLRGIQTQRWGDQTDDKTFALIPFGRDVRQERQLGDYTIPATTNGGWW